ncbi:MAG: endo-1,4-beta-xylanase [Candidatus Aminicenantia bacterium]
MKRIFFILLLPFYILSQENPSPYGINAHLPKADVLDKIRNAGIKWVRFDFNWNEIEPSQGYFIWSECDTAVNLARERGLSIFATLSYTPPWAGDGSRNSVPKDSNLWENFVRRAVEKFKGRISYWGIWNEPNLKDFFKGSVDEYINIILIPAYKAIKSTDPNSKVVAPDLSHLYATIESRWDSWLEKILSTSKQYIDVISHHIYDTPDNCFLKMDSYDPKNPLAPSLLKVIREAGASGKPLWITETGWNTWEVSEDTQADYYKRFLQLMKSKGYVEKVFFYEIIDDPNPNIPPFGILRVDRSEKKAYFAYKEFIENEESQKKPSEGKRCPVEWIYKDEDKVEILGELRRIKEELNLTLQGRRNVELFYKFSPEIILILSKDTEAQKIFRKWVEKIAFAWKNGEEIVLEEREIEEIKVIAERIKYNASPSLNRAIEEIEREVLSKERIHFREVLNFVSSRDFSKIIKEYKR